MEIVLPAVQTSLLWPEIILATASCFFLLINRSVARENRRHLGTAAFLVTTMCIAFVLPLWETPSSTFDGAFLMDHYAVFFKVILLIATALTILLSKKYLTMEGAERGEYYALILLATLGMFGMVSGGDLITIYLGLEVMAIASYILAAYFRADERSSEAGLKYFLLGALNSGVILYGLALLYGASGSLMLSDIQMAVAGASDPSRLRLLYLASVLLMAGFGFKIAAVPFHMWAPDVYEGAPTPVTAFLSTGSKAASFAVIIRLFVTVLSPLTHVWQNGMVYISAASMIVGNVAALRQTNVKRLMAYSSIAHAGYMLMGLASGTKMGASAVVMYLLIYLFANIGVFTALVLLGEKNRQSENVADFKGLGKRHPLAAFAITIFLLSLTGIPPTGGFVGKFYLFMSAVNAGFVKLAVVGVLTSVISLYYYMRIVMAMYMERDEAGGGEDLFRPCMPVSLSYAFCIMLFSLLITGLYPAPFFDLANQSLALMGAI